MQQDSWVYGSATQTGLAEDVVIPGDKPGLTLIGDGGGSMGVNWQPATSGSFALTVEAIDTKISGINFWGGYGGGFGAIDSPKGVFLNWVGLPSAPKGENTVIENCTFNGNLVVGIQLVYTYFLKVRYNHFQACLNYGIYATGSGIASCEINNNWFQDCGVNYPGFGAAMWMPDADDCLIHDNRIFNDTVQGGASGTNQGIYLVGGNSNMVTDNYFSCLLPVPAAGDYDDFNAPGTGDAWINNHCLNGLAVTNPV
jgi:hypothetical protein